MSATIFTAEEAKKANIELITDSEKGRQAVHDVVVAMRANRRAGTASTKTKGEVALSGAKPWRQKEPAAPVRVTKLRRSGSVVVSFSDPALAATPSTPRRRSRFLPSARPSASASPLVMFSSSRTSRSRKPRPSSSSRLSPTPPRTHARPSWSASPSTRAPISPAATSRRPFWFAPLT